MKLFKCLLLLVVTAIGISSANAQEIKKSVLRIEKFSYSPDFSREDVEMIRNQIVKAIQNTQRVIVVDHDSSVDDNLRNESERRKQESAMDANSVADMVTLNSNSLLSVSLDQMEITREIEEEYKYEKMSDGKEKKVLVGKHPYLRARLTYTLKITDCQTGMVQARRTFEKTSGSWSSYYRKPDYETPEEAHQDIMRNCVSNDEIKLIILNTFKAKGMILQVDEGNAKKAKTVYIDMGSADGIQKGQILLVYKEFDIAGETTQKLIGEVEIREILGDTRCLAKVKKGGDVIQQVLSTGGRLPVETRDVKARFFGGVK